MTNNPLPYSPSKNKSTTRHAITQILTPRDLQTKATQFLISWDLQTRIRTNPYYIPLLATPILHPKTNRETHYSFQAYDPHLCPTLGPPPENKNKKNSDPQLQLDKLRTRELKVNTMPPIPPTEWHHRTTHCRNTACRHATSRSTMIWLTSFDLHLRVSLTVIAEEPMPPLHHWLQWCFVIAPPLLFF